MDADMIILAFDSTAKAASVAVTDGDKLLGAYTIDNGLTQSELLLPMAENLLSSLKLTFSDIELLAASCGPGSFTGVRIGAALIKGIAFGKRIPCVSVSTLEALAENITPLAGLLIPCMDARRDQLYTATFVSDGKSTSRLTPDRAISTAQLAEELLNTDKPIYLCGDGYEVARKSLEDHGIKTEATPPLLITENAYSVARVAFSKYKKGETVNDIELSPTYLRMPQAERERLEKIEKTKNTKGITK